MSIPFDELPPRTRIWIYQSSRPFTPQEETRLRQALQEFCQAWAAHGQPLKSGFKVAYRHFVILGVDEAHYAPSGCSLDSSVHLLKALEAELGVSFFDRTKIAFMIDGDVKLVPQSKLKEAFVLGTLTAESLAFNNLVTTKADLEKNWLYAAKDGWIARFIPQASLHL
jgi:hypothetical protein